MTTETITVLEAREQAEELRALLRAGKIGYDECRFRIQPFLDVLDAEGMRIAKKYGKRGFKINPCAYLR